MKQITIPIKGNYAIGELSVKCLSDNEFRARLDKGLCFQCNDKYSSEHICKVNKNRELMSFIANEKEDWEEGEVKLEAKPQVVELETLELKEEK